MDVEFASGVERPAGPYDGEEPPTADEPLLDVPLPADPPLDPPPDPPPPPPPPPLWACAMAQDIASAQPITIDLNVMIVSFLSHGQMMTLSLVPDGSLAIGWGVKIDADPHVSGVFDSRWRCDASATRTFLNAIHSPADTQSNNPGVRNCEMFKSCRQQPPRPLHLTVPSTRSRSFLRRPRSFQCFLRPTVSISVLGCFDLKNGQDQRLFSYFCLGLMWHAIARHLGSRFSSITRRDRSRSPLSGGRPLRPPTKLRIPDY